MSLLSLATPILPNEKLYPTPSMLDGLSYENEFDLRLVACELIQTTGRLLRLPQVAMATAQVLFHRYYYSKSFIKNNMEHYAMGAIFLSSKIEECPRRIRDVMNVFNHIKQVRTGKIIKPMSIDQQYNDLKNNVIKAERRILKELGFCVHVKHPHKIISIYLTAMECFQKDLVEKAWNYMNDSLRTDVFLRYKPEIVACACIYLAARELQIPLPLNPPWFTIFDADEESLKIISIRLIHLYNHKTKTYEELEKCVNECREKLLTEKQRVKEASATQSSIVEGKDKLPTEQHHIHNANSIQTSINEIKERLMLQQKQNQQIKESNAAQSNIIEVKEKSVMEKIRIKEPNSTDSRVIEIKEKLLIEKQQRISREASAIESRSVTVTSTATLIQGKNMSHKYPSSSSLSRYPQQPSSYHSRSRSKSSRSMSISPPPKHKKVKKREKKRSRSRTRSRSTSPTNVNKHKKKKEHRHHSRERVSSSASSRHRSSSNLKTTSSSSRLSSRYPPPPSSSSSHSHSSSNLPPMYMY